MNTLAKTFVPAKRVASLPSLFDTFFNDFDRVVQPSLTNTLPSVNVIENENEFHIELAAPGLSREDFKVNVHEDVLTISSEKKSESESQSEKFTRREFSYSSFTRSFNLPETVDSEHIVAAYTNGILKLTLPKKEEAKPKEPKFIEVN